MAAKWIRLGPGLSGYYARQPGWGQTSSGKVQQSKFYLGKDIDEARDRDGPTPGVVESICQVSDELQPLWQGVVGPATVFVSDRFFDCT